MQFIMKNKVEPNPPPNKHDTMKDRKDRCGSTMGGKHEQITTECPAYGKVCWQCKNANHFHKV